jgi:nitrate reductase delta subunit
MEILKIISRLMTYPCQAMQSHQSDIEQAIDASRDISPAMRQQLKELLAAIYSGDLMDAQETYTGLFDRGRSLSLLLFEHVHGESRDRGQAMVDLMALYENHGFAINVRELPDYIPLYLEYLSHRPHLEAREGLTDVSHILGLLSARLQERNSPYSALFDALLMISGAEVDVSQLREQTASEKRDDTLEALDKIWEEEAVTFGTSDGLEGSCPSSRPIPPQHSQRNANDAVAVRWAN